ncbi:AfsR/SARP family transcriptional regulator [Streptomyces sp. NBC_01013]|uniref:AfsR/SARP family transcriptional regulator n=1 Tax=Streptomyces sp. NBC_01013 TaxID=2903718 RepID=UPI00386EB2F9|nr:winged helix-turn-helix domain-containing protein [Streptomyces sp. NBC_01013]
MRYLILGVTEARDERGTALPLGGTRLRALLAALALRPGRAVPVTELVADVWADEPPADATAALQALVGRLRRSLGKEALASGPGSYRLAARPDDVDLYVFERLARQGGAELEADAPADAARTLRTALALWRGPALADLPDGKQGHALRPEAHRLAALERRIEADLRCAVTGTQVTPSTPDVTRTPATPTPSAPDVTPTYATPTPAALVAELTELTAAHPYDERFRAQLIRALRTDGRQADALAAYEDARRTLAEGLGTDPGPQLTSLHHELLAPAPIPPTPAPTGTFHVKPPRGNLRPRLTSFVGREPELQAIRDDLTRSRLVTLIGPGGSGKTRLAEESASREDRTNATPRDVWLAELAPVEDPDAVPGAVLSALGLRETALLRDSAPEGPFPRTDPVDLLVDRLGSRARPVLLILDNCEHVIGAAAALAEILLTRCPLLRVLATSREPLGVPGESVRPVDPLPAEPAHRLFAERARAVRPGFDPEHEPAHDAGAVAEICRRLDGLPLAIELAAARLRLLGPRQIADRLDDRFRLLTGGSRTVLPRQQTLRAVVDWSWDLLDEDERTALRQVSVFAGGWDLTAAEAVISTPPRPGPHSCAGTAYLIGALVDKSLVVAAPAEDGTMRYRLLETIHEYAVERMAETPDIREAAGRAHTAYFTALVEEAEPRLRSGEQLPWIQRLETDLDNIRAALQRTTSPALPCEPDATRLVLGMGWFWWLRNYRPEGLSWTEKTLALGPDPSDETDPRYWDRMNLHILWFFYAADRGPTEMNQDDAQLHAHVSRVAETFASSGPRGARFPGLLWPMTSFLTGTTDDVRRKIDAAVDNARVHGGEWEYGVTLMFRTHMLVDMPGGMPGIDDDLAELRVLSRRIGDRWMRAQVASAAAEAGMMRGRYDEARAAYEEALLLAREVGAHADAPFLLARLAELSYRTGDLEAAALGLDRSETEAESHQVHDAAAYTHYLRATMAFHHGDAATARPLLVAAQKEAGRGGPPSHFTVALEGLSARISVDEPGGGPVVGLRGLTAALVAAREAQCAEIVTAYLADGVVTVLPKVGGHAAAARILAAADTWRLSGPRTEAEQAEVDAAERLAREELGPLRYEEERVAGLGMTIDDVIDLLEGLAADLP